VTVRRGGVTLGAIALIAAVATGSRALGVVGVGFLLAGGVTWLWSWLADGPVVVALDVTPATVVEGDRVQVGVAVHRGSRVPLGGAMVRLEAGRLGERPCPLRTQGRSAAGEIDLGQLPRGVFRLSDVEVRFSDLLGLVTVVPRVVYEPATVIVRPRLTALDGLFSGAGRSGGDGRRILLRRSAGFDFHSVREYEQGESLRRVHWPSSARRGQLMVKELEDTAHDGVVVILDCDSQGAVGDPPSSSFDTAVRVAGSLVQAHAARGRLATLVSTGRANLIVPVRSAAVDLDGAVGALAAAEPDALDGLARFLAGDHSWASSGEIAVVTSTTDPSAFAQVLALGGRRLVSLVWIDAASFASRPTRAEPGVLRLAAHGVPTAVVRRGDDLAEALSGQLLKAAMRG
jgi:uncharacterized protein (DUF58 family)